ARAGPPFGRRGVSPALLPPVRRTGRHGSSLLLSTDRSIDGRPPAAAASSHGARGIERPPGRGGVGAARKARYRRHLAVDTTSAGRRYKSPACRPLLVELRSAAEWSDHGPRSTPTAIITRRRAAYTRVAGIGP